MTGTRTTRLGGVALVGAAAAAALLLAVALAPAARAAGASLSAAPLNPQFKDYQTRQALRRAAGLDDSPSPALGVRPAPMDIAYLDGEDVAPLPLAYAASFSLVDGGRVSPVKNQGALGTCWTFATMASLESNLLPGELRDFSEDNLALNAGFDSGGDPYNHGGNYWMSSAYLLRWAGPVDESDDAYGDGSTPPGLSAVKHVQEILYVPGGSTPTDTANIKYALTTYGAVATAISWQSGSYRSATASYYYSGGGSINHAVTIVGWNDSYPASNFATTPSGDGAWLVKNSWGTGWGQSGYFWVSYYDTYCGTDQVRNAVFDGVDDPTNYDDLYSYDPLGEVSDLGYGSTTAWAANVFSARADESVAAVGFFAESADTSYTVYAGTSLGSLQAQGASTVAMPGYYTVPLATPLGVTSGSTFVVAVKVTTPGYTHPIACEYAITGYSSQATASPGQSYISSSGSSWTDLTSWDSTANVCLKAYAVSSASSPSPSPSPSSSPSPSPSPSSSDTTAPVTTASGQGTGWHRSPVTVSLSAIDPGASASGVDFTWYQLDSEPPAYGTSVVVPAPAGGAGDGIHTISYRSTDFADNQEATKSVTVKIDTVGPRGVARRLSVRRGRVCRLRFAVRDALSTKATCVVRIKTRAGATKKKFAWGYRTTPASGSWWTKRVRWRLPTGTYLIVVTGKDQAGNWARAKGVAKLIVR